MTADPFAALKAAQREGWALFAPLETFTTPPAGALVTFAVIWQRPEDYAKGNRARADAVPDSVLRRQLDGLEWPEADEAHRIVHLDGKLQVLGVEGSILGAAPWGLPERAA